MRVWVPDVPAASILDDLPADVTVERIPDRPAEAPGVGEVDVLVAAGEILPQMREAIPAMAGLELIQTLSAGIDWMVDLVPDGVTLCSARGVHDGPVAEWTVGAILAMQRGLATYRDQQREGRWAVHDTTDLDGARALIVGHGSIGRAVEARLAPFGVTVDRIARRARPGVATMDALDELLPQADVVIVLLALTPETEGIVDARFLSRMRDGALLVNPARGRHVVTADLLDALRAGRVRAALDVTDPEPLPEGHALWSAPGVLITPHAAGDVHGFPPRAFRFVREQLERRRAGEPLRNVVSDGY